MKDQPKRNLGHQQEELQKAYEQANAGCMTTRGFADNEPKKTMVQRLEALKAETLTRASDKTQKIDSLIRDMKRFNAEELVAAAESFLLEDLD